MHIISIQEMAVIIIKYSVVGILSTCLNNRENRLAAIRLEGKRENNP